MNDVARISRRRSFFLSSRLLKMRFSSLLTSRCTRKAQDCTGSVIHISLRLLRCVTGISLLRVLWKVESAGSRFWASRVKHPLGRVRRNFFRISTFDNVIFSCSNTDYSDITKATVCNLNGRTKLICFIFHSERNPLRKCN